LRKSGEEKRGESRRPGLDQQVSGGKPIPVGLCDARDAKERRVIRLRRANEEDQGLGWKLRVKLASFSGRHGGTQADEGIKYGEQGVMAVALGLRGKLFVGLIFRDYLVEQWD